MYRRLGGTRMLLLIAIHPVRVLRMAFQSVVEWLREEWERAAAMLASRATHAEGIFPFVRILSNVIVRELQTMAIVLDVWLGVPVIYSTYMQYDELAHHFGPSSTGALSDLKRTDARIAEIWRMIRDGAPRHYDLVILSDHGMTPAKSYRVLFKESLGTTVTRMMARGPDSVATSSLRRGRAHERERGQRVRGRGAGHRRERGADVAAPASRDGGGRCARCATGRAAGTGCARSSSRRSIAWTRGTSSW